MFATYLGRAREFIWTHARLLDRRLFLYLFDGEPSQPVTAALKAYQNADGGFGHALEADVRCPLSYPIAVETAFTVLDLTGALSDSMVQSELVLPACDFLQQIAPLGGVPFSLPVVNAYPHAPWWQSEDNPPPELNPTAGMVGLLMKHHVNHPWVKSAEPWCWQAIAGMESDHFHDLMPVITFLENVPDRDRAGSELARLAQRIRRPGVVELDPHAGGYIKLPLDWAPMPDHFCRALFEDDTLQQHLAALAARQQADGGWPINWKALSPAAEQEWRGWVTLQALQTLRAYELAGFDLS